MRRLALVLAAAGLLAIPATAQAAPTPTHATPYKVVGGGGCSASPNGADVTMDFTLTHYQQGSPSGLLWVVLGGGNGVIYCQPRSGTLVLWLQEKTSSGGWFTAVKGTTITFPYTKGRGFSMAVGPYVCQGTNTYWRMALVINGVAHDGTPQHETQYYTQGANQTSGGQKFNCG